MAAIERKTTIKAPADKIFSYVADFPRHSEWAGHRLQIKQTSEGSLGVGTTFSSVGHMMGQDHADQITVTEFVPNSKIAFEASGDAGLWRHYFQLLEEGERVQVSKGSEILKPALMTRFLAPVAKIFVIPSALEGDLKRIKAKLEGSDN